MKELEMIAQSLFLLAVIVACYLHMNRMGRGHPLCEMVGFWLGINACLLTILSIWLPELKALHPDTILYAGLAVIGAAMSRAEIHAAFQNITGGWHQLSSHELQPNHERRRT